MSLISNSCCAGVISTSLEVLGSRFENEIVLSKESFSPK